MQLLICALLPVALGGFVMLLRRAKRGWRMAVALLAACGTSAAVAYLIFTGGVERTELFRLSERFVFALRLDGAGKVYLAVAAVLWPLSVLYAVEYMRHEEREGNFFAWFIVT